MATAYETIAGYDPWATAGDCTFDDEAADFAANFFRELKHVKGSQFAGKPFALEDWQTEVVRALFGWKRPDGTRRFRQMYLQIPRKNGKTTLCAGIALYLLMFDKEAGAEVYCAASTRDQAAIVFEIASGMVRQHESWPRIIHTLPSTKTATYRDSKLKALAAEAGTAHGMNPHGVVFDELHVQKDRLLWEALQTGMSARRQPLLAAITTAGSDKESLCYEQYDYACKVRDGLTEDPSFLPVVYEALPDDDWTSPEVWAKANPCLGVSKSLDYMAEHCKRAQEIPLKENSFKQLELNIWTESDARWIGSEAWESCRGEYPEVKGMECYAGLDLGSRDDLTAFCYLFTDGKRFFPKYKFWVPEETVRMAPRSYQRQYQTWISKGLLTVTPGKATEYSYVRRDIEQVGKEYPRLKKICYDPWNAGETTEKLSHAGFEMIEVRQGFASMSFPMKAMEEAILNETFVHDGNPIMTWMIACTEAEMDAAGNTKPSKKLVGTKGKIDGVVATIMAMDRAVREVKRSGPLLYF